MLQRYTERAAAHAAVSAKCSSCRRYGVPSWHPYENVTPSHIPRLHNTVHHHFEDFLCEACAAARVHERLDVLRFTHLAPPPTPLSSYGSVSA